MILWIVKGIDNFFILFELEFASVFGVRDLISSVVGGFKNWRYIVECWMNMEFKSNVHCLEE